MKCPMCKGRKIVWQPEYVKCPSCYGMGEASEWTTEAPTEPGFYIGTIRHRYKIDNSGFIEYALILVVKMDKELHYYRDGSLIKEIKPKTCTNWFNIRIPLLPECEVE